MQPTTKQFAELRKAGQLAELGMPEEIQVKNGQVILHLNLPREAVSLLVLDWRAP